MRTVTKEFYKEKLIECINTRYGGVSALKRGNSMSNGEVMDHMYKELAHICKPAPNETSKLMELNRTLFNLCRNEIMH